MSQFDDAIEQILKESREKDIISELNMGRGGISNQSGSQSQPVPQGNGAQTPQGHQSNNPNPAVAVQPQSGGANTVNPNAQSNNAPTGQPNQQSQQIQGANPDETQEFNNLIQLQKQNPDAFNKQAKILANDPQRFSRFIAHLSQPMS